LIYCRSGSNHTFHKRSRFWSVDVIVAIRSEGIWISELNHYHSKIQWVIFYRRYEGDFHPMILTPEFSDGSRAKASF